MAQIWLTYQEMAEAFGGDAASARARAIMNGWVRLKGRDGVAHVRLTPTMARDYMLKRLEYLRGEEQDRETELMINSLRAMMPTSISPSSRAAYRRAG